MAVLKPFDKLLDSTSHCGSAQRDGRFLTSHDVKHSKVLLVLDVAADLSTLRLTVPDRKGDPFVVIARCCTLESTLDELFLWKHAAQPPADRLDLKNATQFPHGKALGLSRRHAITRWASIVVRAIGAESDPRTLLLWGRSVGASPGAIRAWCQTAGISPRYSLYFTRVLRATVRHQHEGARPEDLLDAADRRTLAKLLALGQATGEKYPSLPASVTAFLNEQRWIQNTEALSHVKNYVSEIEQDEVSSL